MGQPEGVSDCVVRTTEASIGKQGPSSQRERERTGNGEQESNAARARKMGNGARAIRQADEHRARREGEKGKGRRDSKLAQIDHRQRAREGVNLGNAWASKSLREP